MKQYKPTHYKDGWGIKKINFFTYGTLNAPKDGRVHYTEFVNNADY